MLLAIPYWLFPIDKDLEHQPSDTLRTWNMVPHPRGGNVTLDEFFK